MLNEMTEEADEMVKQSKKGKYLRSFKEFLGIQMEPRAIRANTTWIDRMCGQYKW